MIGDVPKAFAAQAEIGSGQQTITCPFCHPIPLAKLPLNSR
jgi:hypothetical protein